MSVRMALAKLCACTCGGALIGGGAMQVADAPAAAQVYKVKKKVKGQWGIGLLMKALRTHAAEALMTLVTILPKATI